MRMPALKQFKFTTALALFPLIAAAETYDRYAFVQVLPSGPSYPKNVDECHRYAERTQEIITKVETAHDGCLREEAQSKMGTLPADEKSRCSNPACQGLHDARDDFRKNATRRIEQCLTDVSKYQAQTQNEEAKKKESRMRQAQTNQCSRDWLQYEAVCVGEHDSASNAKNCSRELNRLRRSCPDR